MDAMRTPDRIGRRLGETEIADLSLDDELCHRTNGVLDRRIRIDAVLIVEVDVIDTEPSQRSLARLLNILRLAAQPEPSAVSSAHVAELRRDDNVVAMSVDCPTDELFVRERTVGVRGVEEGDAERERALDRRQRFGIITPEVEVGHAHTAQAEGGDSEALSAKGTCLHEVAWQVREPNDGAYS